MNWDQNDRVLRSSESSGRLRKADNLRASFIWRLMDVHLLSDILLPTLPPSPLRIVLTEIHFGSFFWRNLKKLAFPPSPPGLDLDSTYGLKTHFDSRF